MSNTRQAMRFYAQWSHEEMQKVYDNNGLRALVHKGSFLAANVKPGFCLCMGDMDRKQRDTLVRAFRNLRLNGYPPYPRLP